MKTMMVKCKDLSYTYNDVEWVEGKYGTQFVLHLSNGETATFSREEWELWDLTPVLVYGIQ